MKFNDINEQYIDQKAEIDDAISKVLSSGDFIQGQEVKLLETELSKFMKCDFCITCANGTDALQIALMALNVGPGDEIIIPSFGYVAAAEAVKLVGANIVYADVSLDDFNICTSSIVNKISHRTKAIIAISLYGQPAQLKELKRICDKYKLNLIDDCAQSFGSMHEKKYSPHWSQFTCTSFFPTKPLGCFGDGGAIFTNNKTLAEKARKISQHGQSKKYQHDILGMNSRLDTLQAGIIRIKLKKFQHYTSHRERCASLYYKYLNPDKELKLPIVKNENTSVWAQFTIKAKQRDSLAQFLQSNGIPTAIHYPLPLSRQISVGDDRETFHHAEKLATEVLSLPLGSHLDEEKIKFVCDTINRFYQNEKK